MSLGEKLRQNRGEAEAARIAKEKREAEEAAAREASKRAAHKRFVDRVKLELISRINEGKEPWYRVSDYEWQHWVRQAMVGNAPCQEIWSGMTHELRQEGLVVKINDGHDGMGVHSWINVYVDPI